MRFAVDLSSANENSVFGLTMPRGLFKLYTE